MEALTLAEAKDKRSRIRAATTRAKTFIEAFNPNSGSRHEVIERKKKLSDLWNQFDAVQSHIESLETADSAVTDKNALIEQQNQQRISFENTYFILVSRYETVIE
jgi:hypothetical protein